MGGLVATALASVLDVPRLILLAPAFKASIGGLALAPFVAPFLPVLKRNKGPGAADRDPLRLALHEEYRRDDLVAPAAQLRRLQLFARRRLPEVRSKIFIITATEDRSVPPTVGAFIEKKARLAASIDCAVIEGAGHIFPFDLGAERAQALIAEWMKTK
jgi:esterase/lipase